MIVTPPLTIAFSRKECCRPLKVEVFELADREGVLEGWEEPKVSGYKGRHGLGVPLGEGQ